MSTEYFRLTKPVAEAPKTGLSWPWQIFLFLIAAAAVVSRRPDAVLHAQFFAEDGRFWYADAYNTGWLHALFLPNTGYFSFLPRLAASVSLWLPLQLAPLFLNLVGIAIQALPVPILLSARLANWASLPVRAAMAAAYIALPNSSEIDATVTNAQWHLALVAALLVFSQTPRRKLTKIADAATVALSGLTGPFCLILFPLAGFFWFRRRTRWTLLLTGLLGLCAAVQLYALTFAQAASRSQAALGASSQRFLRMLAADVYLGAVAGGNHWASQLDLPMLLLVGLLGTAIVVYCWIKASLEARLFLIYCFAVFAASLRNPMISYDLPQWQVLEDAPGLRYWFFPMVGFLWAAIWCVAFPGSRVVRVLSIAALAFMLGGVCKDWQYISYPDEHFNLYAEKFEHLPPGHAMLFPLYPPGWTMELTKKGKTCGAMPTGFIDRPGNGAKTGPSLTVEGWIAASEPRPKITIWLNGKLDATLTPDIPRPDVDAKYPGSATLKKGWRDTIDLSRLPAGANSIEVHAELANGCESILGTPTVVLAPRL